MKVNLIIKGIASYVPGVLKLFAKHETGGTNSAMHCYRVWFKHLTLLHKNGMRKIPDSIAELGPGDSIGVGLAALLSGVNKYYALDVVTYANTERNLKIFDELVELFKKRAGKPAGGWPEFDNYLDEKLFPSHILTEKILNDALAEDRIQSIRNAILNNASRNGKVTIQYIAPWNDPQVIDKESVDIIISSSVMEHVDDLENTYKSFLLWIKKNAMMSHQIDFGSHAMSEKWNGHWLYSPFLWKIITGKKLNMINRQPCSKHIRLLKENKFEMICLLKSYRSDGIKRSQLSSQFKDLSEDDLTCSGMFFQAKKKSTQTNDL